MSPLAAPRRRMLLCLPFMLLAACAAPPGARTAAEGVFSRSGRFAVSVTAPDDSQEAAQGGFSWQDDGQRLQIDVTDPAGGTLARVVVDAAGAEIRYADGRRERAPGPDALLAQVMGAAVPVSGLRYWLRGQLAAGEVRDLLADSLGQPARFEQDGWRLSLSRYDRLGPTLLQLNRHDSRADIRVRLAMTPLP